MSDSGNTKSDSSAVTTGGCCGLRKVILPVVALVFLRLCCGWHFFSEGIKKVEYDQSRGEWSLVFSAEPFLNGAVGPLADFYHSQAPTSHEWRKHLVVARQLDPAKSSKLTGWVASYVKRRQGEINSGKPTDAQFANFSPAAAWGEQVRTDWQATLKRFTNIKSLSEDQRKSAEALLKRYDLYLADFLAEESLDIEAYQHQLWRLEQAEADPAADEVPFEVARVADQQATVDRTPGKWVAQMKSMDEEFAEELRAVAGSENRRPGQEGRCGGDRSREVAAPPERFGCDVRSNWRRRVSVAGTLHPGGSDCRCVVLAFGHGIATAVGRRCEYHVLLLSTC